jgi:hypothetical protein
MKFQKKVAILALAMLFALSASAMAAEKGFLWNGTHWKDMNSEIKVAYVKGIGNMADFETASPRPLWPISRPGPWARWWPKSTSFIRITPGRCPPPSSR